MSGNPGLWRLPKPSGAPFLSSHFSVSLGGWTSWDLMELNLLAVLKTGRTVGALHLRASQPLSLGCQEEWLMGFLGSPPSSS